MRRIVPFLLLVGCASKDDDSPPPVTDSDLPQPTPDDYCAGAGLTVRPFQDDLPELTGRGNLAADFRVKTLDEPWSLAEAWTGCEVYVFLPDQDGSSRAFPTGMWERDLGLLLEQSPENVQWFFFSTSSDPKGDVRQLREDFETELGFLGKKQREHWEPRLHYLTEDPDDWNNWAGEHFQRTDYGFLIDRMQTIRDVGSLADQNRYNQGVGWFEPNIANAANEAVYANFLSDRQDILDAQTDVKVVRAWDAEMLAGGPTVDLDLGSAEELAAYDVLDLDLTLNCGESDREFGTCGAWDYLVYLHECAVPVEPVNPYTEEACQPYVPGVQEVLEVLGECTVDGRRTGVPCRDVAECVGLQVTDTGTDTGGSTPTGPSDTGRPTDTAPAPTDTATGPEPEYACDGYVAPVEPVEEVPADTKPCSCTGTDGQPTDQAYVCNAEGTGYGDCSCPCDAEIGRWITTYHREGRWIHDASAMLPWLKEGGKQRFRFSTSQPYELTLDFRFRSTGAPRTDELVPLFTGGGFDEHYNDKYVPLTFTVPADATKVDLVAVISGHGFGTDVANCAEFCNHTHHFFVNGDEYVKEHPEANNDRGCIEQVAVGTVPNQFGTWFYGRGGWCPGKEVAPWVVDVTSSVTPGQPVTITYEGRLNGEPYVPEPANNGGFGARIDMLSWLAYRR